ncbi:RHS repeat domain-containing protein [Planctomycetes bacterium TBK1r]|uniref:tRNA3(Ser)-specific nuclease WapA n=1 Tax=Stieleria magnilauensis TaxID=2527963 RepID=A0ABX5Y256_9BACT|nr:tRNA3(Ser)-specific nuclease WapA precursor [Planctomycetes bacterium TBK1r]
MLCHRSSRRQNLRQRLARTRARGVKPCADLNSNRSCKTLRQPTCSPGKSRPENDRPSIKFTVRYLRGQQYSITALTDSSGAIKERYAYDAYGGLSIFDGSGTARTTTAEGNRYTYTGREWDAELTLYHYRARMYDSSSGRFCSRDPIGYADGFNLYSCHIGLAEVDPSGLSFSVDYIEMPLAEYWEMEGTDTFAKTRATNLTGLDGRTIGWRWQMLDTKKISNCCYCAKVGDPLTPHLRVSVKLAGFDQQWMTRHGHNAIERHELRRVAAFRKGYNEYLEPITRLSTKCGWVCRSSESEAKDVLDKYIGELSKASRDQFNNYIETAQAAIDVENQNIRWAYRRVGGTGIVHLRQLHNGFRFIAEIPKPKKFSPPACPDKGDCHPLQKKR